MARAYGHITRGRLSTLVIDNSFRKTDDVTLDSLNNDNDEFIFTVSLQHNIDDLMSNVHVCRHVTRDK